MADRWPTHPDAEQFSIMITAIVITCFWWLFFFPAFICVTISPQIQVFLQDLNQITAEIRRMDLSGASIIPPSSSWTTSSLYCQDILCKQINSWELHTLWYYWRGNQCWTDTWTKVKKILRTNWNRLIGILICSHKHLLLRSISYEKIIFVFGLPLFFHSAYKGVPCTYTSTGFLSNSLLTILPVQQLRLSEHNLEMFAILQYFAWWCTDISASPVWVRLPIVTHHLYRLIYVLFVYSNWFFFFLYKYLWLILLYINYLKTKSYIICFSEMSCYVK